MVSSFPFNFIDFCVIVSFFLTKLLTLGILFSSAVKAVVVVVKVVILANSHLTSFILVLRVFLVAKLVISDILSSIFFILAFIYVFFKTSFFTI